MKRVKKIGEEDADIDFQSPPHKEAKVQLLLILFAKVKTEDKPGTQYFIKLNSIDPEENKQSTEIDQSVQIAKDKFSKFLAIIGAEKDRPIDFHELTENLNISIEYLLDPREVVRIFENLIQRTPAQIKKKGWASNEIQLLIWVAVKWSEFKEISYMNLVQHLNNQLNKILGNQRMK